MLHLPRSGGGGDYCVGWVGRNEASGKELRGKQGEMVTNREDRGFRVKMPDISHLHAASGNTEGCILDGLESIDGRG